MMGTRRRCERPGDCAALVRATGHPDRGHRPDLVVIGDGDSPQEKCVHAFARDPRVGVLFTDDVRCPVHVADPAAALLQLAESPYSGMHHVAGADAVSRYELGVLVARRDGFDAAALPAGLRARAGVPGPVAGRLDCTRTRTRARLTVPLRGARDFLAHRQD